MDCHRFVVITARLVIHLVRDVIIIRASHSFPTVRRPAFLHPFGGDVAGEILTGRVAISGVGPVQIGAKNRVVLDDRNGSTVRSFDDCILV